MLAYTFTTNIIDIYSIFAMVGTYRRRKMFSKLLQCNTTIAFCVFKNNKPLA